MNTRILSLILLVIGTSFLVSESPAQQAKVIRDPVEYEAYTDALNVADPARKAAAMEAFIARFPSSVVKEDALEEAMAAYQLAGKTAELEATARRILVLDPDAIRALAILTTFERTRATQGDAATLPDLRSHAAAGLQKLPHWEKPSQMSADDFKKLTDQFTMIFRGAAGFAALQDKDYVRAQNNLKVSVALDPQNLQDVYQLGIADLEMSPLDPNGFWYCARALNLAKENAAAATMIAAYGRARYKKYHGDETGWDQIVAAAGSAADPPANFARQVTRAPTPPELAVNAVRDNDPSSLSFSDMEFILGYRDASPENKVAADRVWAAIQAKQKNGSALLEIPVKVIKAYASSLDLAVGDDSQQSGIPDMTVALKKPSGPLPKPGATIRIRGHIVDYRTHPFMLFMEDGEIAPGN